MTVSCFKSFFCILNVNAMLLASSKLSNGAERRFSSLKNLIFLNAQEFCTLHFPLRDLRVLTRATSKESGANELVAQQTYQVLSPVALLVCQGQRREGTFVGWDHCFGRCKTVLIEEC
jgi:hypothetical protein